MAHRVNLIVIYMCQNMEVYLSTYLYYNYGKISNIFIVFSMQNISLTLLSHYTCTSFLLSFFMLVLTSPKSQLNKYTMHIY